MGFLINKAGLKLRLLNDTIIDLLIMICNEKAIILNMQFIWIIIVKNSEYKI